MREQAPRLKVSSLGDATIVEFVDRKILDEVGISQIGDQITALVAQAGQAKFIMDFTGVAHMSSSALGMLITIQKRVRERSGQLKLCGIHPAIMEVFTITRLNEVFDIHPTRQDALASLNG